MKTPKFVFFVAFLLALSVVNLYSQETKKQKTLYERLGGMEGITAIVTDFGKRVSADERLNKKFSKSNVERLDFYFIQKFCEVASGPCKYKGLEMKEAHTNMGVTNGEFAAVMEHLKASLNVFKIQESDQTEFLNLLEAMKPQIVEKNTDSTGEPLPANFKPAPPIDKKIVEKGPANLLKTKKRKKKQQRK